MNIQSEDCETLGKFYLGRSYALEDKKLEDELVLYDSKDLVTHDVVLGMTGSGKTRLCFALLEEAAMDNIPAIVIDPKGDLANLLLTHGNAARQHLVGSRPGGGNLYDKKSDDYERSVACLERVRRR